MVARYRQGDIWWTRLERPLGPRPVMLVSRDASYRVRSEFLATMVTTTVRHIPTEVPMGRAEGLDRACVANLDVVMSVPRGLLVRRLGRLNPDRLHEVFAALRFAVGMPA